MTSNTNQLNEENNFKSSTKNRYDNSNLISKLYCLYILPFLFQNYGKNFGLESIDPCSKEDFCHKHADKLKRYWNQELNQDASSPSLIRALIKCFGPLYLWTNFKNFIVYGVLGTMMPVILGRIIVYANRYYEELNENSEKYTEDFLNQWMQLSNRQNVILYSVLFGLVYLVHVLIFHPFCMSKFRYGMHIRVALTKMVYEKALHIYNYTVQQNTVGKIMNLISTDVNQIDLAYHFWEMIYMALLETGLALFVMYQYIGRSCFGTLTIVLAYIPFQAVMAHILSKFRSQSISLTDDRLRLMSEILPAIKVIKMYVWEKSFSDLVTKARKLEMGKIRNSMVLRAINLSLYFASSKAMSFICIILFLLDGGQLNAENVFVTLAIASHIREILTLMWPLGVSFAVETYLSVKRIEKFLLEKEIDNFQHLFQKETTPNQAKISITNVTVKSSNDNFAILDNISFNVEAGKLIAIIGPVGCGKTSILLTILKELPIYSGSIETNGSIAYVSQEAWIFGGTIRENILFGRTFDQKKYYEIVKASALLLDFAQFEAGDQTVVDDRGSLLSGGQRARISLARALYSDADCYLLDDPLSAVDAIVAKHIFKHCIKKYLKNKCVILVTHQLQFVDKVDQIVVMKDGACLTVGSFDDLQSKGIDLYKFASSEVNCPETPPIKSRSNSTTSLESNQSLENSFPESDNISVHDRFINLPYRTKTQNNLESISALKFSQNKLKTYIIYIQAGGVILFSTFVFSNIVAQVLFTGSDYWLSQWTDYKEKSNIHANNPNFTFEKNPVISSNEQTNIVIYSLLVLLLFAFSIIRTVTFFVVCTRASVNLHNGIFFSLMQAPMAFFDKTPLGVIMNRVSRDLGIIDSKLSPIAFESLDILCNSFGVFILCIAINYLVVVPFLCMIVLIYFASRFYVDTARQLKRLEGIVRSPIYNQMSCTLAGLATIRSNKAQQRMLDQFSRAQDSHTTTYFTTLSASRFYGIFMELACVVYLFCVLAVLNIYLDNYSGALVGLIISQSLQLTSAFEWGIRQFTVVETQMILVERVAQFGRLDKEQLLGCKLNPPLHWPDKGEIMYDQVSLSYPTDDGGEKTVLCNLTFKIEAGEKIGVVGRTGAGKSSLVTTLFRLTQPNGKIFIDGINTADISLSILRQNLSIIPQEPILFSGNIRSNLDPFNEKTDVDLWEALEKVQLKAKIQTLPQQLNTPVSEFGSDFSVGQKQLICLARAILRKNCILILDECTANVDNYTDSLIQNCIRTEFAHCTVITIAHRLHTIIDYDRIMVFDSGLLVQFDTPTNLIQQKSGMFYKLFSNLNAQAQLEIEQKLKIN